MTLCLRTVKPDGCERDQIFKKILGNRCRTIRTRILDVVHNGLCFSVAHGIGLYDGESALHFPTSLQRSDPVT